MKYTKKPVTIEAVQWTGKNYDEMRHFLPCGVRRFDVDGLHINTLEGDMRAAPGDYIIKGVKGEFYPCKPDIFKQTYSPVEATVQPESCPFCDAPGTDVHIVQGNPRYCKCYVCGAQGPLGNTDSEAVVFWNDRAEVEK